jgi:hypothetical protein
VIATIDYTFFSKGGNKTCRLKTVWSGATDRARRGFETPATGHIITDSLLRLAQSNPLQILPGKAEGLETAYVSTKSGMSIFSGSQRRWCAI